MTQDMAILVKERIEDAIDDIYIDCPECYSSDDDQYQCGTCGCGNGNGRIRASNYLMIVDL